MRHNKVNLKLLHISIKLFKIEILMYFKPLKMLGYIISKKNVLMCQIMFIVLVKYVM